MTDNEKKDGLEGDDKEPETPSEFASDWSVSQLKIGDKTFEIQYLDGMIFVNQHDVTEFIYLTKKTTSKKRIDETKVKLNLNDFQLQELIKAIKTKAHEHNIKITRLKNKSNKSPDECPFVTLDFDQYGEMKLFLHLNVISEYLIKKFNLLAISDKIQVESLALWTNSNNEYRQLPTKGTDKDLFLIKELQDITSEYGLDTYVSPEWISRIEILRQCEVKRIVHPTQGMFPMANGILDIRNMRLMREDQDEICLVRSSVEYDLDAKCPQFDSFLNEIFDGDQKKVQAFCSWIGAIIAGMNPQLVILFKSRGRSGKGVLMELVSAILSSMMTTENPSLLHERFQNWAFFQRRLIYLDEHNAKDADFDRWKEVSGSCPRVNFETKGVQTMIQADVQCAIIAVTNSPPSYEKGSAWEERLKMLDFPNSYVDIPDKEKPGEKKVDYGLKDKLMIELPGIVNKFLVYARYSLDHPDKMFMQDISYSEIERALDRATESLDSFINDFCEVAPMKPDYNGIMRTQYKGYSTTDITFMKKYEEYCADPMVNVKALSKSEVKKKLKKEYRAIVERHNISGIKVNYPIPT